MVSTLRTVQQMTKFPHSCFQNGHAKSVQPKKERPFVESFEKIPLLTAATTFIGFYLMLLMGYVSSLLFTPNVAQEKNRKVNLPEKYQFISNLAINRDMCHYTTHLRASTLVMCTVD
jgi:hypothetical protein